MGSTYRGKNDKSNLWKVFILWFWFFILCETLYDLVQFAQFKKSEKHPWISVTFKPAIFLKVTLLHGCFSRFLNGTNDTKFRTTSHMSLSNESLLNPFFSQSWSFQKNFFLLTNRSIQKLCGVSKSVVLGLQLYQK